MVYNESKYNKNWKTMKLSDLGEFARGKSTHRPRNDKNLFEGGGYPLVQTGEIKEANLYITHHTQEYGEFGLQQSKLWDAETLCITIAANIAETALLAYPMCFPDSVVGFKAYKEVSSEKFMYYVFDFIRNSIQNAASGSTQDNINIDYLTSLDFKVPDKIAQDKMVELLSAIDEKILMNSKINDNLEQQAKLIYDYWFTQFDFPDENGKPYCSSGGKMVWNEQLKRNIPENWNVVPLLKLVSWESNSQPPKSEFVYEPKEGYVRFIQNRDYDSDTHITYIPRTKNLSIVDRFDILMDKYGDAGAVRYGIEGAFNVALGKICVHNPNYREYIRSFLGSDGIYKFLHNSCMASTRASLSEANLAILNVVVPDEKIILDYENFLHKIRVSILKNKEETVELINLRDWLLPMLMNGQATIAD